MAGIVCNLTHKRADFEKECGHYILDEAVVAMEEKAVEEGRMDYTKVWDMLYWVVVLLCW